MVKLGVMRPGFPKEGIEEPYGIDGVIASAIRRI